MAGGAMLGLLYDVVDNVQSFVQVFIYVYSLLIGWPPSPPSTLTT